MLPKKKLQVFVSSTYTDLRQYRQAAVEAILTAGHIPAGMELFAAGDQSQMSVIKQWIDESDVFLLILGGRYGSIESNSKKSYIHLEYEYALQQKKPLFAVVMSKEYLDKQVKEFGTDVIETEHTEKLNEFRSLVQSRMVKFWSDSRDIKLSIHETMANFSRREDLAGWLPGDQAINAGVLAEEIARLTKENANLREKLAEASTALTTYDGLTFEQMCKLLSERKLINLNRADDQSIEELKEALRETAENFGESEPNLLHFLWYFKRDLMEKMGATEDNIAICDVLQILDGLGLLELGELKGHSSILKGYFNPSLTSSGRTFLFRLMLERSDH